MEDSICAFFQTNYNQIFFSIKKEIKEDKNINNSKIIHNCFHLKQLTNNVGFVRNLFFKIYKVDEKYFICFFILCNQIGYFYKINITIDKEEPEEIQSKVEDFFENEIEENCQIIYKFEDRCTNFFYCFEYDNIDKKPIKILVGDENFKFHLINLKYLFEEENFLDEYNFASSDNHKKNTEIKYSEFFDGYKPLNLNNKNKEVELNIIESRSDFSDESNSEIKFENNQNDKNNNSLILKTQKFMDKNQPNSNKREDLILIHLNELVLSYHNINKIQFGATNFSLNAKLIPEEFINCFIKQNKIFFFFKNFIYCYNIENQSIIYAYYSKDIIKDICFTEEIEEDKKNYHKSYILNNIYLSLLKFQIEEDQYLHTNSQIEENNFDEGNMIRNYLKENKLVI
jgi:hypothetical protein